MAEEAPVLALVRRWLAWSEDREMDDDELRLLVGETRALLAEIDGALTVLRRLRATGLPPPEEAT